MPTLTSSTDSLLVLSLAPQTRVVAPPPRPRRAVRDRLSRRHERGLARVRRRRRLRPARPLLSDGWQAVQREGWRAPAYWQEQDGAWRVFTSAGVRPLRRAEPVCHVSFYEADAYARWAGARLPTEQEWETAVQPVAGLRGQLLDPDRLHPGLAGDAMVGDVWEWTASAYLPYPGFRPVEGAIGEYDRKFMCDQHVLRGASCATPAGHERTTYRNFFGAGARWAFGGLRLAR